MDILITIITIIVIVALAYFLGYLTEMIIFSLLMGLLVLGIRFFDFPVPLSLILVVFAAWLTYAISEFIKKD